MPPTGAYAAQQPPPPAFGPPGPPPPGDGPPGWTTTTTRKGPPGRTAIVSIVAVLAALAGGFAVVNISTGGQSGATSPEAAVEDFFDAVSNQDFIGVLEVLDPGERDMMVPFVKELESNLSRLGLTESMDLSDVPGINLEVTGLEVEAHELEDGLSEVQVTAGDISYETLPDDVPIGRVLEDLIKANDGEVNIQADRDSGPLAEDPENPPFLVATEVSGRWHVSFGFTIAEYARQGDYNPRSRPHLDAGIEPNGAASPEDAIHELAAAASDLDLERMIALLPPDSMRAAQVYAPLYLPDAQADLDRAASEDGLELDIEVLSVETTSVDGGTRVVPTGIAITVSTFSDGLSTLTYEDDCLEVEGALADELDEDWGDTTVCWDDVSETIETDLSPEEQAELEELMDLFEGFEPGIVVVEVDGEHYIDPLRTFGDVVIQIFDGVERSDLEEGGILYRLFTGDLTLFEDFWEDDYWDDDYYSDSYIPDDDYYSDSYMPDDDNYVPPVEDPWDDTEPWDDSWDDGWDDGWDDDRWDSYHEWADDWDDFSLDCISDRTSLDWDAEEFDQAWEDCLDDFWDENGHKYEGAAATETTVS